ncbi:MAG: hypothetical protein AAGE99_01430 [Chlamydiota bacterium]
MASGIPGPDGIEPTQGGNQPEQIQTGMTKMYSAEKAPGFAQMLELWFPGKVTPQMVTNFEKGVMQMISNSIKEAKAQHAKVQEEIRKRIQEN